MQSAAATDAHPVALMHVHQVEVDFEVHFILIPETCLEYAIQEGISQRIAVEVVEEIKHSVTPLLPVGEDACLGNHFPTNESAVMWIGIHYLTNLSVDLSTE
nr:hypothetical protein HmN_000805300 [Hymenolepis microstoma]